MAGNIDFNQPQYPIRIAAKILNISVHTLRMYEKKKLILPYKKSTKHRLYSDADLERIKCIRKAIKELNLSINGLKTIYSLIPCWEYIGCSEEDRKNCLAYTSYSEPCWAIKGTTTVCAEKKCRECIVYNKLIDCRNIKDFVKTLLRMK